jgi:hypothetical protein
MMTKTLFREGLCIEAIMLGSPLAQVKARAAHPCPFARKFEQK